MRGDDVYLVRWVRVAPIPKLAADPGLKQLASSIERLHLARSAALESVDREIKRTRPGSLSGAGVYVGIAVSVIGLADAVLTMTTGIPWVSVTLAIAGVASSTVGVKDKVGEHTLRANRNFERTMLRRDLEEITQARTRIRQALDLARRGDG